MLSEDIEKLEIELFNLKNENLFLKQKLEKVRTLSKGYKECCKMVIPTKVYFHKERGNTTVKFGDGSSITVKKRKGEKHCIETAIAYCIMKQLLSTSALKKLVKEMEEH
jgi:hypothetical protein